MRLRTTRQRWTTPPKSPPPSELRAGSCRATAWTPLEVRTARARRERLCRARGGPPAVATSVRWPSWGWWAMTAAGRESGRGTVGPKVLIGLVRDEWADAAPSMDRTAEESAAVARARRLGWMGCAARCGSSDSAAEDSATVLGSRSVGRSRSSSAPWRFGFFHRCATSMGVLPDG